MKGHTTWCNYNLTATADDKEKLTVYSEGETSVEDDRARFSVGAGLRVGGCACVAP